MDIGYKFLREYINKFYFRIMRSCNLKLSKCEEMRKKYLYGYESCAAKSFEPSMKYELTRKRIRTTVNYMWDTLQFRINELMEILPNETTAFNHIKQSIYEHKIMILSDLQQMTEHDGYQDWRLREKENLENIFQARFNATQFAKKCGKVRHLKCYDNFSDCDWGKRSYFYKLYIPDKICYKISKAQKLKILKTQNLEKLKNSKN